MSLVYGWLIVLLLIGAFVYYPGIYRPGEHSPYWGDDYQWVFASPSSKVFYYFAHTSRSNGFYRPIQAAILAVTQSLSGSATWPIAAINLLLHISLALLVFLYCTSARFSVLQSSIASLFMMVSQANAQAVAENDTTSQVGATTFACLALFLLYRSRVPDHTNRGWPTAWNGLSVLSFIVSLFFKETSLAFLGSVLLVLVVEGWPRISNGRGEVQRIFAQWVPYFVVTAIYLLIRSWALGSAHPALGSQGRYSIHVGVSVIRNLIEFVVAEWIPVSSVSVFTAVAHRQVALLAVVVVLTGLIWGAVTTGMLLSPREQRLTIVVLFALSLLAGVPALVLNQTSELYVYNAMPFVSAIAGISVGRLVVCLSRHLAWQTLLAVLVLFVAESAAVRSKEALLRRNGDMAARLLPQIVGEIERTPAGTPVYLMNPAPNGTEYSEFLVTGFHVFANGENIFAEKTGQGEIFVTEIGPAPLDKLKSYGSRSLVLTYQNSTSRVRRVVP